MIFKMIKSGPWQKSLEIRLLSYSGKTVANVKTRLLLLVKSTVGRLHLEKRKANKNLMVNRGLIQDSITVNDIQSNNRHQQHQPRKCQGSTVGEITQDFSN